jgi:N-glycosidase YbiA
MATIRIKSFRGAYRFLSNFYPCSVSYNERKYPSVEHAYQAAKSPHDPAYQAKILRIPADEAGQAKALGQSVTLREDWEDVRIDIMLDLIRQKFRHPKLRIQLKSTDEAELIEGNYWFDTFWGVCNGHGENHLGKILMKVRDEL